MNRSLFVLLLLISPLSFAEYLAVVASPLAVELSNKDCIEYFEKPDPSSNEEIICMDRAFLMKYKVDSVVLGEFEGSTINFIGLYHHWGIPPYTQYEPALLILETEGNHLLLRYIKQVEDFDGKWHLLDCGKDNDKECKKGVSAAAISSEIVSEFNK